MPSLTAVILLGRDPLSLFSPEVCAAPATEWRFLARRFVLVNEPATIERVLASHAERYGRNPMSNRMLRTVLGDGMLTSEGEVWRAQREQVAPVFRRERLAQMSDVVTARVEAMLDAWEAARRRDDPVDVSRAMSRLALESVAGALFSIEMGTRADALLDAMDELGRRLARPRVLDALARPSATSRRAVRGPGGALRRLVASMVRERAADRHPPADLLTDLVAGAGAGGAGEAQVVDQVLTMLVAGHETTAVALAWAWHLLAAHPDSEARLHAEVDAALGGRLPAHADMARLPYTKAVLEETLRLYPPAIAISRLALVPDDVGPRGVRPGDLVMLSAYATQRNPALWAEPLRFQPERFVEGAPPRYGYVPFGAGTRACVGRGFAMMEAMLVLAALAGRYRLERCGEQPVEATGRLSLRPREPIRMRVRARARA